MTNKAIRARFAERLETAHKTPKTAQSISLGMYNRLWGYEADALKWPRWALACDIRAARRPDEPVRPVVELVNHPGYEEDVRNEIYYGREIARDMRNAR